MMFKTAGTCGFLAPVLAFAFILLAVASYPQFSWPDNALSDLGVVSGVTAVLFNSGLIVSGALRFIFATGLSVFLGERASGRTGAFVSVLASLALAAIGVFPESVRFVHYFVSVAFFVLLPVSMLFIVGAFWLMDQARMAVFTFLVAVVAAGPWVLLFSVRYVSGVAIPEFVSGLADAMWTLVLSGKMLRQASRSKIP
jgi:hypothetical membrane protein